MCSTRIGHVSSRTGKEIVPTIAHSCELAVGHDGPHFSPMDRRSILERAQWDAGAKDRLVAQGPLARLQGTMERVGAADPDTGRIIPAAHTLIPCPQCGEMVTYADIVPHAMEHATVSPYPRPDMIAPLPLSGDPSAAAFPKHLTGASPAKEPSDSQRYSHALNDVLDWVVSVSQAVQLPAKVAEAVQVLRPSRKG